MNTGHTVALLVASSLLLALVASTVTRRAAPPESPTANAATPLGPHGRQALERCRYNVTIIHDVHWAAVCESNAREVKAKWLECLRTKTSCEPDPEPPDDMPDCTLPPSRAFNLNNARATAENHCHEEAVFVERNARRPQSAR